MKLPKIPSGLTGKIVKNRPLSDLICRILPACKLRKKTRKRCRSVHFGVVGVERIVNAEDLTTTENGMTYDNTLRWSF